MYWHSSVTSWWIGHPQPIQKLRMLLEQLCISNLTLSITSIERGLLQNPAQIRHLPITIKQPLCTPNYDITVALGSRDGVVHKILVRKLHRTAQFYPHTALHCKKFVNLIHRTANPTASQNIMVNSIA